MPDTPAASTGLDDLTQGRPHDWWDAFYADQARPIPFFCASPDESLVDWIGAGMIARGIALDLGCGNGRNAIFLAKAGFEAAGVDFSLAAIQWATQRAREAEVELRLQHASVFELDLPPGGCDLVYDSGCFHHLPPHQRARYVALVSSALKPGGWFGLTCFRPEGGSGLTDEQACERKTLGGGLGYTEARLREIWAGPLRVISLRQMVPQSADSGLFGESFLWAMLAQKPWEHPQADDVPPPRSKRPVALG